MNKKSIAWRVFFSHFPLKRAFGAYELKEEGGKVEGKERKKEREGGREGEGKGKEGRRKSLVG